MTNIVAFVIVAGVVGVGAEVTLYSSFIANSQSINFYFDFDFYLSSIMKHAKKGGDSEEKGEGLLLFVVGFG